VSPSDLYFSITIVGPRHRVRRLGPPGLGIRRASSATEQRGNAAPVSAPRPGVVTNLDFT
jgi:hypothetical protein